MENISVCLATCKFNIVIFVIDTIVFINIASDFVLFHNVCNFLPVSSFLILTKALWDKHYIIVPILYTRGSSLRFGK